MNDRTSGKTAIALVLLFASFGLISCSTKAEEKGPQKSVMSSNADRDTTVYIVPGQTEAEGMKAMMNTEEFKKIEVWGKHLRMAGSYERAGNYDQAEVEYKKVIELAPEKIDEWEARSGLARIYETTDQYEKAIEQLDWLIKGKPRKDVLDELLTRKQKLEQLLAEQTQSQ